MTLKELERLKAADIEKTDRRALADIEKISIDYSAPFAERMLKYLDEVKNPYCFLCGKTPVRICFKPDGGDLDKKLKSYFLSLKR